LFSRINGQRRGFAPAHWIEISFPYQYISIYILFIWGVMLCFAGIVGLAFKWTTRK
jgi:hypothetical protein